MVPLDLFRCSCSYLCTEEDAAQLARSFANLQELCLDRPVLLSGPGWARLAQLPHLMQLQLTSDKVEAALLACITSQSFAASVTCSCRGAG